MRLDWSVKSRWAEVSVGTPFARATQEIANLGVKVEREGGGKRREHEQGVCIGTQVSHGQVNARERASERLRVKMEIEGEGMQRKSSGQARDARDGTWKACSDVHAWWHSPTLLPSQRLRSERLTCHTRMYMSEERHIQHP